jgi:hypothetical protein
VLPERLDALALKDVRAEVQGQLFRGGSSWACFGSLTWLQARDRIVAAGTPAETFDRARADLMDERRWFHGPATIIATGRRPAAERRSLTA